MSRVQFLTMAAFLHPFITLLNTSTIKNAYSQSIDMIQALNEMLFISQKLLQASVCFRFFTVAH